MESQSTPSEPTSEAANPAIEAPSTADEVAATPAPAAETPAAAADKGPNMKGLPQIKKAEVIGSVGTDPRDVRRPFGSGSGGGPFGGGGDRGPRRDDRGPRRGPQNPSGSAPVPDTRSVLRAVTGESNSLDAELSAEIDAMVADFANADQEARTPKIKPQHAANIRGPRVVTSGREHRTGRVVSVGPSDIFLEFGPKELGVVQRTQYKEDEVPKPGDNLEVVVDRFENAESLFICSKPGAIQKAAWELLEVGQTVEARVTGTNKGGLELEVAGHKAFMPAGQVSLERIADLAVFVGEKLPCQVVQIDRRGSGNIVLSRRDMLKSERAEKAEKLAETLTEGAVMEGTVRKIMPFGAFVDIGGIDGLLHIADMSFDRVFPSEKNVAKFVKEGAKIQVQILKLDLENKRISLGMKQLMDDPFMVKANEITEGAEVTGKVVRFTEFGAFVELSPGVDGLVHISEIARRRIEKPQDVLKLDEIIRAKVLKVDQGSRKIALSIKALLAVEAPQPGSRDAMMAEKRDARDKASAERFAEIQKESPELRRKREQFRNKELSGGFGKKFNDGGGLAGLGNLLGKISK